MEIFDYIFFKILISADEGHKDSLGVLPPLGVPPCLGVFPASKADVIFSRHVPRDHLEALDVIVSAKGAVGDLASLFPRCTRRGLGEDDFFLRTRTVFLCCFPLFFFPQSLGELGKILNSSFEVIPKKRLLGRCFFPTFFF